MESLNRLFWCGVLVAALAACGRVDEPALVTSVEKKLAEGRADAAAFEVKAFLQQAPESARARHLLGRALLAMGDAAGAETELRRATSLNSADESLRADLARALNLQQRYDQASELATEQALTAAKSPALGLAAAAAWLELGDHASAEQLLGQLRRQFPGDSDVQVAEINLIAAMRGAAQALPLAADLVKKHPEHAGAWKLQGDVFTATGKGDPTPAYERAVALDKRMLSAYSALAQTHLAARQYDKAGDVVSRMKQVAPMNAATWYCEALLFHLTGRFDQARDTVQMLLRGQLANPHVLLLAGLVERRLGSLAQAETLLAKAVAGLPKAEEPRRELARLQLSQGKPALALEALDPLLKKPSIDPMVWLSAGHAHAMQGDAKAANQAHAHARSLKPTEAAARVEFGRAMLAQGQTEAGMAELRAAFEQAAGLETDLPLVFVLLQHDAAAAKTTIDALEHRYPLLPVADLLRGQLLLQRKDPAGARAAFEQALAKDPLYRPAIEGLTEIDLAQGRASAARARFLAVVGKHPRAAWAMLAAAGLGQAAGVPWKESASLIDKAVATSPSDPAIWLAAAEVHRRQGDFAGSLSRAQQAVTALPNDPDVQMALSRALADTGNLQQAVSTLQRAVTLRPQSAPARVQLAELLVRANDKIGARAQIDRALTTDSASPDVVRAHAMLLLMEGKAEQAQAVAAARLKAAPKDSQAATLLADVQMARGRAAEAVTVLRQALVSSPSQGLATRLSTALRQSRQGSEADRFEREWLKANPQSAEFIGFMAQAAERRGDSASAEAYYRQVLALHADAPLVLNNLAHLLLQRQPREALTLAQRAVELLPNSAPILDTLAQAHQLSGDARQAARVQERTVELAPRVGDFRLTYARMLAASGDRSKATQQLNLLASTLPDYPRMAEVRQLTAELLR